MKAVSLVLCAIAALGAEANVVHFDQVHGHFDTDSGRAGVNEVAPGKPVPTGQCIRSCQGVDDGDYQSCLGCHVYASCGGGVFYDNRPCPANLVWDDKTKRCEYNSTTCPGPRPPTKCVFKCKGKSDGNYQSCHTCHAYVTCSGGKIRDDQYCPGRQVWDDVGKKCQAASTTCNQTRGSCISDCQGRSNGPWQSCKGCDVYAVCWNGRLHDSLLCPSGLVWDDTSRRCQGSSSTCKPGGGSAGECVRNCCGRPDGAYQSCQGCSVYAECKAEVLTDNIPCPRGLAWDDISKKCVYRSRTCAPPAGCITSCAHRPDGDYQSCRGCRVYASCSGGVLYDNRPCPWPLLWDDKLKLCSWTSSTCPAPGPRCVYDCKGLPDGSYQDCKGCHFYAQCKAEKKTGKSCAAGLVWDDNLKRCDYSSSTCSDTGKCVSDCKGRTDGDYQACDDCSKYVSCAKEKLTSKSCPSGRYWDDYIKTCLFLSSTCQPVTPGGCIKSCQGKKDGDYQSCQGCHVYASCGAGVLYDNRPCPANLVWDDKVKRCEWTSSTCKANTENSDLPVGAPDADECCITGCTRRKDGDYQLCGSCPNFAKCAHGQIYVFPCPANLLWDDSEKRCLGKSTTCPCPSRFPEALLPPLYVPDNERCIRDCTKRPDGDYQSCISCHVYATCTNQMIIDNRPCPGTQVWDDDKKRCQPTSATCPGRNGV